MNIYIYIHTYNVWLGNKKVKFYISTKVNILNIIIIIIYDHQIIFQMYRLLSSSLEHYSLKVAFRILKNLWKVV